MSNNIFVYTFRTFPYLPELQTHFDSVFVLNKLKNDLNNLCQIIKDGGYQTVLGIAKAGNRTKYSMIETVAINKFTRIRSVDKNGPLQLNLNVPPKMLHKYFKVRKNSTTAFCNYAMYKTQLCILQNKLETKHVFIHIKPEHIQYLDNIIDELNS